jgi:hypothetical protein
MNQIEDELKAALRRKPAPPGFASRVLERIDDDTSARNESRRIVPNRLRILAVAAAAALIVWAGLFAYQQHIRARNEAALQRTLTAISIAAVQLDRAERKAFELIRWEQLSRQLAEFENNDKE